MDIIRYSDDHIRQLMCSHGGEVETVFWKHLFLADDIIDLWCYAILRSLVQFLCLHVCRTRELHLRPRFLVR